MVPGFNRGQAQGYPRQHAHVGDAGPPYVGTATLKVPPAWSIERNHTYTLRCWISDLVLWASATDIEPARQGPIAAMQVTGSAKELIREIPPERLSQGAIDPQTGNHITGFMILVQTLARRYSPLDGEAQTRAVSDFLNFHRIPQENVDAFLVRFDVLRNRATMRGGLGLNHQGLAWLLLRALAYRLISWIVCCSPLTEIFLRTRDNWLHSWSESGVKDTFTRDHCDILVIRQV